MTNYLKMTQIYFRDRWTWVTIPSMIIGANFIVSFLVSVMLQAPLYTGSYASVFIYAFVLGILIIPQTFPLAIGLSTTRKDYFIGTMLHSLINGTIISLLLILFEVLERVSGHWWTDLHFFYLPYLHDGSIIEHFLLGLFLYLFSFHSGLIIASIYRRFGGKSVLASIFAAIVGLGVVTYCFHAYDWLEHIFTWIAGQTAFQLSCWTLPITMLYTFASYLMLRKSEV